MPKRIRERVQIGVDENGAPIYKWATGTTMQEVLENAAKILTEYKVIGESPKQIVKHRFEEYADNWFRTFKKPSLRDITAVNYEQQMRKHLYPTFGDQYIEDITAADVQEFLNARSELAKDTQQKQLNILRMIFEAAIEDGFIMRNPAKSQMVKLTSAKRTEREPLSREKMQEVIALIPKVVDITDRCFIAIQALHGMRPCEVLGLKWEDIDFEKGTISIERDVVHPQRNQAVVSDTKTQLSKRKLSISELALPHMLEAAKVAHAEEHQDDFVFGGAAPLSYPKHRSMMRRICRQMEVDGVTGYTFRHTVITDIYETTHDANIAAAVAGHSKTSITLDRYSHARRDSAKRGMEAFDSAYAM